MSGIVIQLATQPGESLLGGREAKAGWYLKTYQPEAMEGYGLVSWTPDAGLALVFRDVKAAWECWQAQPVTRPLRDDGKPNKPLTAYTIEFVPVGAEPDGDEDWRTVAENTRTALVLLGFVVRSDCLPHEPDAATCGAGYQEHAAAHLAAIRAVTDHQLTHIGAPDGFVAKVTKTTERTVLAGCRHPEHRNMADAGAMTTEDANLFGAGAIHYVAQPHVLPDFRRYLIGQAATPDAHALAETLLAELVRAHARLAPGCPDIVGEEET